MTRYHIKKLPETRLALIVMLIGTGIIVGVPVVYASGVLTIEDSIDTVFERDIHHFTLTGTDERSILMVSLECGNTDNPSTSLDPTLFVTDPNGNQRFNDDGLLGSGQICGGFGGSILVYLSGHVIDGTWETSSGAFSRGTGPYTLDIILSGPGSFTSGSGTTYQDLIDALEAMNLHHGIENSLKAKINASSAATDRGQTNAAINSLDAFMNQVKAQTDKKITMDQADDLIAIATLIITDLANS